MTCFYKVLKKFKMTDENNKCDKAKSCRKIKKINTSQFIMVHNQHTSYI